MTNKFKTYDNTILIVGKKYRWSGYCDWLYTSIVWDGILCKITKIEDNKIFIYDYSDNKEFIFNETDLEKNKIKFKKLIFGII